MDTRGCRQTCTYTGTETHTYADVFIGIYIHVSRYTHRHTWHGNVSFGSSKWKYTNKSPWPSKRLGAGKRPGELGFCLLSLPPSPVRGTKDQTQPGYPGGGYT